MTTAAKSQGSETCVAGGGKKYKMARECKGQTRKERLTKIKHITLFCYLNPNTVDSR